LSAVPRDPAPDEADEQIVQLIQSRSEEGLRRLLQVHGDWVKGALMEKFGRDREIQTEEAISDAALGIWDHISGFDPARGSLSGWLLIASRNALVSALRIEMVRPLLRLTGQDELECLAVRNGHPGPRSACRVKILDDLKICIARLSPMQQDIILSDLSGESSTDSAELARRWQTTANSIRVSRHKAHKRLEKMLEKLVIEQ
jgi:RNA polymerase sigma factor (sigma-70 family)